MHFLSSVMTACKIFFPFFCFFQLVKFFLFVSSHGYLARLSRQLIFFSSFPQNRIYFLEEDPLHMWNFPWISKLLFLVVTLFLWFPHFVQYLAGIILNSDYWILLFCTAFFLIRRYMLTLISANYPSLFCIVATCTKKGPLDFRKELK